MVHPFECRLEELVEKFPDFEYDAHLVMIDGKQFGSDFVALNPNSKIPCMAGEMLPPFLWYRYISDHF